jgi:arthrofactin-type cyclic lipopeptide synthetase C
MVARLHARGYVANVPFLLRATGALNLETLRDALQLIVDRHEILRSSFGSVDGVLVQYGPEPCAVGLDLVDISGEPNPLASAKSAAGASCRLAFAIDAPMRLRLTVYRLSAQDHLIAVIIDHLAADGMSLAEIGNAWRSFYQAIEAGTPFTVPAIVPQYRAFAGWQRAWLQSPAGEAERIWWADQLRGFARSERAPELHAGPFAARVFDFVLDTQTTARISRLCVRHRLTPFMVMLSVYALLLAALSCDDEILVATVRANRRQPETRATVGQFANLIPLLIIVNCELTGEEYLRVSGETCRASYAHDALPFLDIAGVAWKRLGIAPNALAEFSINFVPFGPESVAWTSDLRMSQMWGLLDDAPLATSRLALFVRQQVPAIGGTLIFDPETVDARWATAFPAKLRAIISALDRKPAITVAALLAIARSGERP